VSVRSLRYYIILAALVIAAGDARASGFMPNEGLRSGVVMQNDPAKQKEITAKVARSTQDETISLAAVFPEDATGIKVSLYNLLGKLIDTHPTTSVQKGEITFRFQTKGLPNGPYILVLEANGQRLINKVMVSR
jgi:hypothetical protein